MKILVVSQYFWPESFLVNDLCVSLCERGHEVTVYTGVPNYPGGKVFADYSLLFPKAEVYKNVKIKRVPLIPRGKGGGLRLLINYFSFALTSVFLAPFKCRGQFDLIFVMQLSPVTVGLPAVFLKFLKKAPIVFWVQDLWPESLSATGAIRSPLILRAVKSLVKFIYSHCDVILIQSEAFREKVRSVLPSLKNIRYLPNWAPGYFVPKSTRGSMGLPGKFRVMFAGNVGAAQNLEVVLDAAEALREHKEIHWLIVGDGRASKWLEKSVAKRGLGDRVHLLGRHPIEKMPNFFAEADCMLVTLKKDPIFEMTVPSKVQVYLACGKPIVTALDGEGSRIVAEARAGYCGPSGDSGILAENVLKLYRSSYAERQEFGRNGRDYFERHFEQGKVLDDLASIMDIVSVNEQTRLV